MSILVITGASSFIGQHLLSSFSIDKEVRVLIHEKIPEYGKDIPHIVTVNGDLLKPESLIHLMEPGCTVINLAYLTRASHGENLDAADNLIEKCIEAKIRRLVHCSTAVVVGGVREDIVTEDTPCDPRDEYEMTKLQIEELIKAKARGHFEIAILRPTAVFGPGGKNLLKLAGDLSRGNAFVNYLKSCLYGSRRMNLVCVDNVVAAILYLAFTDHRVDGETFIISDDEHPGNNYKDVEKLLAILLGCKEYPIPRITLPKFFLAGILRLAGRSNSNPNRIYSSMKIRNVGFREKTSLEAGLSSFAEWYKRTYLRLEQTG